MLAGCSKDEILNHYNNIVQSAGSIELTGKSSLQGEKEKGIDDYTGTYTADYANFSGTEYLFGGTSIKREAGKELSIDCTLEIMEGTAKVFWISGSDEAVTLIEASILDNVTRESVESTLVKNGNRLVRNSIDVSV